MLRTKFMVFAGEAGHFVFKRSSNCGAVKYGEVLPHNLGCLFRIAWSNFRAPHTRSTQPGKPFPNLRHA